MPSPAPRPVRADVARNRAKLLKAAQEAFATADGPVSLEAVAKAAEVGIGTLYRHFPTREDLVEAVYGAELDEVVARAPELLADLPPEQALRAWMDRYAAFVATKHGMLDVLRPGWASGRIATPNTRERLGSAVAPILAAGAEAGVFRTDIEPTDITALISGALFATAAGEDMKQLRRLLDLIVDAARA